MKLKQKDSSSSYHKHNLRSVRMRASFEYTTLQNMNALIHRVETFKILNCYDYNEQKPCDQATYDKWRREYICPGSTAKNPPYSLYNRTCTSGCQIPKGGSYVCQDYLPPP